MNKFNWKKAIILFSLLGSTLLWADSDNLATIGQAPDFSLEDFNGNQVSLSQYEDKLILLDFWATWCVPCLKALPHLSDFQEKYADDLQVLTVNIDKSRAVSRAKALVKTNDYKFTSLLDTRQEVAGLYNVVNPPRTLLIDSNLNIIWQHDGYKQGDEAKIEAKIQQWIRDKAQQKTVLQASSKSQLTISGINQFDFVYKDSADSLNMYANETFSFDLRYQDFRLGLEFSGEYPKYKKFEPIGQLAAENLSNEWGDIYAEYNNGNLIARGGKYDLLIGSGMTMHAHYDEDLDEDSSLQGFYGNYRDDLYDFQLFYGLLPSQKNSSKADAVNGADLEIKPNKALSFGLAAVAIQQYQAAENYAYNRRETISSRLKFSQASFELQTEYAQFKQFDNEFGGETKGNAFYSDLNLYLNKYTFTAAYKNYDNFFHRMHELPTANSSERPLADYGYEIGSGEEGVMAALRFVPNSDNELVLNAAYGWSDKYELEQADILLEYNRKFSGWSLTAELKHLENKRLSVNTDIWSKESSPALIFSYMLGDYAALTKTEFTIKEHSAYQHLAHETTSYEPMLQFDLAKGKYSGSIFSSYKFADFDTIMDYTPKLGLELVVAAWEHTSLKFFVGSEKGGIVCRNGVCQNQAPFDGARFSVTTRF
ncbi:MAG: DUF6029 family protein [Candidatus Cloacimonadales bacterium]